MPSVDIVCVIFSKSWNEFCRENKIKDSPRGYTQSNVHKSQELYFYYLHRLLSSIKKIVEPGYSLSVNVVEFDQQSLRQTVAKVREIAENLSLAIDIRILGYPLIQKYIKRCGIGSIHDIAIIHALHASQKDYIVYLDLDVYLTKPGLIEYCIRQLQQYPRKIMCTLLENKLLSQKADVRIPRAYALFMCLDKNRLSQIIDMRQLIVTNAKDILFNSRNSDLQAIARAVDGTKLLFDSLSGLTMYLTYETEENAIISLNDRIPCTNLSSSDLLEVSCEYFVHTRAMT